MSLLYGPHRSWRLGRSLGVDPLAPCAAEAGQVRQGLRRRKRCSFDCSYCQLGPAARTQTHRQPYAAPEQLYEELLPWREQAIDWVTFAGLGEPTLAANLGDLVRAARAAVPGRPLAILTNSSLIGRSDVRGDLTSFDLVVAKLDAADEPTFRQIDRPAAGLALSQIVDGLLAFRRVYGGRLALQVMLVAANRDAAGAIAALARSIAPDEVQLNTPLQPALGGPLTPEEMEQAARHFAGLPYRTVYDTPLPQN